MIVIFSNKNDKELSKMYDGCSVADYFLKLIDTDNLKIEKSQDSDEKIEGPTPTKDTEEDDFERIETPAMEGEKEPDEIVTKANFNQGQSHVGAAEETHQSWHVVREAKDLLTELQVYNLPQRKKLSVNDAFNEVLSRNSVLIFSVMWGF